MNRPRTILPYAVLVATALALALPRPAAAQKIDVKLGLWEMTSTVQMGGVPPVDASKMTPEQRARLQAAMAASKKAAAQPHVTKSCLTKEKLAEMMLPENHSSSCKPTVVTDTTTDYAVRFACSEGDGGTMSGEWHFHALTPESVKGTGQMTMARAGQQMTSTSNMTAKWIAASCGDVK